MASATNTCEGTSGTTVSTSNSSGPDQFQAVTSTSATVVYDNTHAQRGSTSIKFATSATAVGAFVAYTTLIGTQSRIYGRAYLFITGNPSANTQFFTALLGSTQCFRLAISTSGKVILQNSAGATLATSTAAISANTWMRVEFDITCSTTSGVATVNLYTGDSESAISGGISATGLALGTATVDTYRFGQNSSVANIGPYWLDDVGLSSVGLLGPSTHTVDSTLTVTAGLSGAATVAQAVNGALTVTAAASGAAAATHRVDGALTVTVTLAADVGDTHPIDGALDVAATATGDITVTRTVAADLHVTAVTTAAALVTRPVSAGLTVTAASTAGALTVHPTTGAIPVTVALVADAAITHEVTGNLSVQATFTATGRAQVIITGDLTVTASSAVAGIAFIPRDITATATLLDRWGAAMQPPALSAALEAAHWRAALIRED